MLRLAGILLRAVFWLGLVSLFVPGSPLREAAPGGHVGLLAERTAQDTLTPADRVASWRGLRKTGRPDQHQVAP